MSIRTQIQLETLLWSAGTVVFILVGSYLVGSFARWVAKRAQLSDTEGRKIFWGFFFASPWLIGFFIFVLGPSIASLYYSFTDYKLVDAPRWIGLENYQELIRGDGASGRRFTQAMYNSMYYAVIGVPLQILASLIMAMLLNTALKGIRLFRLIFYLPVILAGGPAVLLAWRYMFGANGGFVNVTLQKLADSFFLFDWLYRGFIFSVESFNGFYAGLTRGDAIGPLKFTFPALIGVLILVMLARGDWDEGKRNTARRAAELIGIIVGLILVAGAVAYTPIPVSWVFIWGLVVIAGILLNADKPTAVRAWQIAGLLVLASAFAAIVYLASSSANSGAAAGYIAAIMAAAVPILATWNARAHSRVPLQRRQQMVLLAAAAVFLVILFIRAIPGQLDGGRLLLVPKYLAMQTALENPDSIDYLEDVFPVETMSSLWIYGAVIVTMLALSITGSRLSHQAQKRIVYAALAVFALFTVGSLLDTFRYFGAFETIAATEGERVFHFTLFRSSIGVWPDNNRVPLWLSSELWSKPSLILITMWSSGAGMLIFLAALKGVPQSYYEAAEVDGASRVQRFFKITLPLISPAMFYNIVIGMIAALQTFDTVYILQNTQTQDSLASAAYYLYQRTFQQLAIGQGAAMSWILAIIIVILTVIQFRYSNWVHYEA